MQPSGLRPSPTDAAAEKMCIRDRQYLASLVANHVDGSYFRITLDVGNYREKRKETLESLGKKMAARAVTVSYTHLDVYKRQGQPASAGRRGKFAALPVPRGQDGSPQAGEPGPAGAARGAGPRAGAAGAQGRCGNPRGGGSPPGRRKSGRWRS